MSVSLEVYKDLPYEEKCARVGDLIDAFENLGADELTLKEKKELLKSVPLIGIPHMKRLKMIMLLKMHGEDPDEIMMNDVFKIEENRHQ